MKLKKIAKKEIQEARDIIQNLPVNPDNFTYVRMYQCAQELNTQGKYLQVIDICKILKQI